MDMKSDIAEDTLVVENIESSATDDEDRPGVCYFLELPTEIFLHICSFLDARFITQSLSLVCKHFNFILSDNSTWKARILKRWKSVYPALPVDPEKFNWRYACALLEDEYNRWSHRDKTMTQVVWSDIHYASVDAVLLMNSGSLCVSGSRDRSLATWNLRGEESSVGTVLAGAHGGWIWNLASCGDTLYSCSWDNTVKTWSLQDRLQEVSVFKCQSSVLALACEPSVVAAGLFTRKVMLYDPRLGDKSTSSYLAHNRAVLALAMVEGFIVSVGDDQTIAVWDRPAAKILKRISLSEIINDSTGCPTCLSLRDDSLYVGDTKGKLHFLNSAQGLFELLESFSVVDAGKMTAVQHGPGSIMTSSTDGMLRVFAPTRTPEPITVIQSQGGEVAGFDYKNNVLAMGGTNSTVEIWMPSASA